MLTTSSCDSVGKILVANITLIGDIHGDLKAWYNLVQEAKQSVQVGDFGIGFLSGETHEKLEEFFKANQQHEFIRGNHDNPALCKSMKNGYIPDGTVDVFGTTKIMYIGGAESYDRNYRLLHNLPWWPEEELTYEEQLHVFDAYVAQKPDIVVSHDAPQTAIQKLMVDTGIVRHYQPSSTQKFLDALWKEHQPSKWFFGHWHVDVTGTIENTEFKCLGINEACVVEI